MTHKINHAFVSTADEGSDPSKVRTSNWNADHSLTWGFATPNTQTISEDVTLPTGYNYQTVGPLVIADTKTVTVPDGVTWVVI